MSSTFTSPNVSVTAPRCNESEERIFGTERAVEIGLEGPGTIPVTCLQNIAMALKQNLAGVVNENRTGSI
jgi:hypothetical protein